MELQFIEPHVQIRNPSVQEIDQMIGDLSSVAFLHLIVPEQNINDGADNASLISDTAVKLGLPASEKWEEVYPTMLEEGYQEVRIVTPTQTNHFFLKEAQWDEFEWLDPYLH